MEDCSFAADMDMHDLSIKQGDQNVTSDDFSNKKNVQLGQTSVPNLGLAQASTNPEIFSASTADKTITTDGQEMADMLGENLAEFVGSQKTFPQAMGDATSKMFDQDAMEEYATKLQSEWS